jgi:hypothetical protein
MSTHSTLAAPGARTNKRTKTNPVSAGLPDPRPLTEYDVVYAEVAGASRITIVLKQPCVIRSPRWSFIDCATGNAIQTDAVSVPDNQTIVYQFGGIIAASVAFVDVPWQDTQVQNFQGGFVRPGGKWFRAPK